MTIELVSDDLALFVISRVMITLERAASSIQLGKGHPPNLFNYYDLTVLKLPVIHTDLLTLSTTPIQYKYTFVLSTGITYSGL